MNPELLAGLLALLATEGLLAVDIERLARSPSGERGAQKGGAVAVIPVTGLLMNRSMSSYFGERPGQDALRARIESAARNPDIAAIVLDIESPGGTVAGTAETAATVRAAAAQKPVVAVANALAASAAYWIASQASELVVAPNAEVGSIGVLAAHQNLSRLYERMGVETTLVSAGKYKAEATPFGPLSDEAKAAMQARADAAYEAFVADVAAGRKVAAKRVKEGFGAGRVVEASAAVAAGMADRVAPLSAVVAELAQGKGRVFRRRTALAFA